ncbi:hypothetical protein QYE76_062125 [Lolium multiflorum]|uniref:Uncharacterized protein n=1 Tax=Lolium multiflorum TaxID=4521 RepID=A0AAD8S355_LOLMU|nr:hypothetical protein QYE76_062125 [Lolium multiflorum]
MIRKTFRDAAAANPISGIQIASGTLPRFMVIGSIHSTGAAEGKICPLFCVAGKKYMTCPSTGRKQLEPACNCCLAGEKGRIIYFSNGNVTRCPS